MSAYCMMKQFCALEKGVGLIERKKQGQGKPTRIYVKRFTTQEMPPQPEKKPEPPAPPPGVEFADVQKSDFPTSRRRKNPPQEVEETDPNQTKRNQLDFIQRRHIAATMLNQAVPTIIQKIGDADAKIIVADGNLHRDKISSYFLR